MNTYYSENATQKMKEFDNRKAILDAEFEKLTAADFDSWDPEDDYIPELDDIKPVKDVVNTNNNFNDDTTEWDESYNIGIDDTEDDMEIALNINIEDGFDFDINGGELK